MNLQKIKMLAVGLIVLFPILLALDVVAYRMTRRTEHALREEVLAGETLRAEERIAAGLTLSELAARMSLTTKDVAGLNSYRSARQDVLAGLDRLQVPAGRDANLEKSLASLGQLLRQQYAAMDQRVGTGAQGTQAAAQQKELDSRIHDLGRSSQELLSAIRGAQESALAARDAEANSSARRAGILLQGSDALALWSLALAALLVFRDTQRRGWAGVERRMHTRVLEALPLAVCVTDDHGTILYSNPAEQALFGYAGEDLVARHISLLEGERERAEERHRAIDQQLLGAGSWAGELPGTKRNGATFRCAVRATQFELAEKSLQLYIHERVAEAAGS